MGKNFFIKLFFILSDDQQDERSNCNEKKMSTIAFSLVKIFLTILFTVMIVNFTHRTSSSFSHFSWRICDMSTELKNPGSQ